jgi:uncharacterized protein (DUF1800 family)
MILNTPAAQAAHLLRRTHFAFTAEQIEQAAALPLEERVERLLNAPVPTPQAPRGLDKEEQRQLPLWWLRTMATTDNQLVEKLTLFWHGHFTSAAHKVKHPDLLAAQNELLRKHALGNFRRFTYDISIDPAMMLWLDNHTNNKKSPNENYARELMELFTLGIGPYTEDDVREAARALTGWKVNKADLQTHFLERQFDNGTKTLLGRTGRFGLKETVDIIVDHPACASFIARKLWEAFAYPHPEPQVIAPIAEAFRKSGYEIKALLRALFTSEAFYSDRAYRSLIKSPAEYVVHILRTFPSLQGREPKQMLQAMHLMGQMLFDPPNVAGWPGGPAWLGSSMMFARFHFAEAAVLSIDLEDTGLLEQKNSNALLEATLSLVGLTDLSAQTRQELHTYLKASGARNKEMLIRGLLHLVLISPEAQTL